MSYKKELVDNVSVIRYQSELFMAFRAVFQQIGVVGLLTQRRKKIITCRRHTCFLNISESRIYLNSALVQSRCIKCALFLFLLFFCIGCLRLRTTKLKPRSRFTPKYEASFIFSVFESHFMLIQFLKSTLL